MVFKHIIFFTAFLCGGFFCSAQNQDSSVVNRPVPAARLLEQARRLHRDYQFEEALDAYEAALEQEPDSLKRLEIEETMIITQNSISMMDFCSTPVVVAKQRFSMQDFFLFYPLGDGNWRPVPNALDTLGTGSVVPAMYIPEDTQTLYFSAKDENDIRNLFVTEKKDSIWTVPSLLGEGLTTSSDEVFPMLSPDGKTLYFSSRGLYGMGGYDLYFSNWDEEQKEWGQPVNMGFPYSSPYDDYLYIDTPDGEYSMFASNRDCSPDSVCIYVLEYDGTPVRTAVTDQDELRHLSSLDPVEDLTRMDNGSAVDPQNQQIGELDVYAEKLNQVRSLSDSMRVFTQSIETARQQLADAQGSRKEEVIAYITRKESLLPVLQDSLNMARKQVQDIEMQFLLGGVSIDPDKVRQEAEKEVVGASSSYTFTKNRMGSPLAMNVLKPVPQFDYSFRILPVGCFAENNELPSGIVYQIQIFAQSSKATVRNLKGLSPVFEQRRKDNGKYVYSVGLFRSYQAVLDKLNQVKKLGFRSAFITAYSDGKPVSVRFARSEENHVRELYQIRIVPADGLWLSDGEMAVVKGLSSADLIKINQDGQVAYLLGPFNEKEEAEVLLSDLQAGGLSNTSLQVMKP